MPQCSTLDSIGLKYGTDKTSPYHDYLNFYETFFTPLRNDKITILEIGVLEGASLRTWEEYFPNAKIIGADIRPETRRFERDRVIIELLDQSNIEELTQVSLKHGPFDIIIEDGSHMWEHQITSLRTLFPFLKNDGLYVVEDLQTNYGSMQDAYKGVASRTCVDYLKSWLDLRVADDQLPLSDVEDAFLRTYGRSVQFLTFYRRACLIKKRVSLMVRSRGAGLPILPAEGSRPSGTVGILAHISYQGDVFGPFGFVNPGSSQYTFQGLSLACSEAMLEYRVRNSDDSWSDWARNDQFIGSRGQAKLLTGVTVRLADSIKGRFTLHTVARFVGVEDPVVVLDSEDCISLSGQALCGLQVELAERPQVQADGPEPRPELALAK